jgi:hypothetical protein
LEGVSFFKGLDDVVEDVVEDDVVELVGFLGGLVLGEADGLPVVPIFSETAVAVFLTAIRLGAEEEEEEEEGLTLPFGWAGVTSLSGVAALRLAGLAAVFRVGWRLGAFLLAVWAALLLVTLLLLLLLGLPLEVLRLADLTDVGFPWLALFGTDLLDLRAIVSAAGAEPFFPRDFPLAVLVPSADLGIAFGLAGVLGEVAELAPRTLVLVGRFLGLKGIYPVNLGGL